MNSLGRIFRINIYGESHGPETGVIIDGCPSGISVQESDFIADISRRKSGAEGTTERYENDAVLIKSGCISGKVSPSSTCLAYATAKTGSIPLEASAIILMVPVGAIVVVVAFRMYGDEALSKMLPL